jgi:membrane protein implicated in regulation of membrane protease activity
MEINHLHWWIFATLLMVLEITTPGIFFMWLGIAAILMGFLLLAIPALTFGWQILIFSIIAVIAVILGNIYVKKHPIVSEQPLLNQRMAQYIGRIFSLTEPIVNGIGKARVDDSIWTVEGPDCSMDKKVKVIGINGMHFQVEPLEKDNLKKDNRE